VDTLLAAQSNRGGALDSLREWLECREAALGSTDEAWWALIKLLVASQNRYRPRFTGRESIRRGAWRGLDSSKARVGWRRCQGSAGTR
jgi:hypothetical protein